jgi:hypothetical protein
MNIQAGALLISRRNGQYYRVVECCQDGISLMRVNGYTLFTCNPLFIEDAFQPAGSLTAASLG